MDLDSRYRWYRIQLKDENLKPCTYTFRGLTKRELRIAGTKETTFDAETFILETIVFPKKNWETMLGGVALKLMALIYEYSGLTDEALPINEAVNWIQTEDGAMEAIAVSLIPSCSPDVLDNCDPFTYAKYLMIGKFHYETMYGRPVEEAFMPRQDDLSFMPNPGPAVAPGPGEIGKMTEDTFQWSRRR